MPLFTSDDGCFTRGSTGTGLMLDGITTGIKYAFSTRKLLTAYAGSAIQVQRLSDNATQNIGFVGNVLDTASLATFCSGTTGRVITWYDQSGNATDLTASAFASAPIIYQSGAVNTLNSQPAPLFVAGSGLFLQNTSVTANPVNTLYQNAVIAPNTVASGQVVYAGATGSTLGWQVNSSAKIEMDKTGAVSIGTSTGTLTAATGVIVEIQYNSSSGVWAIWINRSASGSGTSAQSLTAGTTWIGKQGGGPTSPFGGPIGELVSYDLVGGIPGASQTTIVNNQHTYWGTP